MVVASAVYQSSVTVSSGVVPLRVASSLAPVSVAESHAAGTSLRVPASQVVTLLDLTQPDNTSASSPAPTIQQENLLEITLRVNTTVDIFDQGFQTALTRGLLLTFLQASQLNGTRTRRAAPLISVEIFTLSRVSIDNVLVQFAVLEDGKPMKAVDVMDIFNRFPDLLGTLNENLPFQVVKAPSVVAESPRTQISGWLAAVVVLAAACVLLAALLGVFVKKSQGAGRVAQNIQGRASTPFKEGRLRKPRVHAAGPWASEDAELGEGRTNELTVAVLSTSPDLQSPTQPAASSSSHTAPAGGNMLVSNKDQRARKRKLKKAIRHHQMQDSPEDSYREGTTEGTSPENRPNQVTREIRYEGVSRMHAQDTRPQVTRTGPRFKSTVTPLPPLQPQRLTGTQVVDNDEALRPTGSDINIRSLYRQEKPSVSWVPRAVTDRDQQRKADAERLRNKKRLRDKQRQSQSGAEGEGDPSRPGHGHGERFGDETPRGRCRGKAGASRTERDLAAWRRVQAQISSLLEPERGDFNEHFRTMQGALAFPQGVSHLHGYTEPMPLELTSYGPMVGSGHPFYSAGQLQLPSAQLANNSGPWAQPWQKAPIPNTRHNAEFLRSLQIPHQPPLYPPSAIPPRHPSFFPPPSGLSGPLVDRSRSSSTSESKTPGPPSPDCSQAAQTAQMNVAAAYHRGNPLLSPGSQNYLQLLTSLSTPLVPCTKSKRKAKKTGTKEDSRTLHPAETQHTEGGPESM